MLWRLSILALALSISPLSAAERPGEAQAAQKVDALLAKGLADVKPVSDEAFIRRVSLDLTGKLPGSEEVVAFAADPAADKRARLIDRLLHSEAYAINWGRYWRDVVTYHTPASGNYIRWQLFDQWWTDQVRKNRDWDEVVTALVTATGVNDEVAPVNYLTGMFGNPVEIASHTSRVFLGVQLQCAECHHAKTERWKREQFHEFVAFFGRARIIQHKDVGNSRGTPYAIEGRSSGQYQMVSKRDPSQLIDMQPRFLTGESVAYDADDTDRRAALARYITSPTNPYFAKAYVNRMWNNLLGWGFYPSVQDLGSHEPPQHPQVLEALAQDWIATGYDPRWLFRTITLTRAYQSQLTAAPTGDSTTPPGYCPVRLRPEQVFEALQKALGFAENDESIPAPAPKSAPAVQRHTGLRNMVYMAFRENPSLPFGEVNGTIPQALLMMNSALVTSYTSANGKTILAQLLEEKRTDEQIVMAIYERVLTRKPKLEELETCRRYIAKAGNRSEAFEDILWSLVNSAEFLIKK